MTPADDPNTPPVDPQAADPPAPPAADAPPASPPASDPPAPAAAPPAPDWRDRRISTLTGQNHEKQRRIAELEAQLATARGTTQPAAPATPPAPPAGGPDFEARVQAEASARAFSARCDEAANVGNGMFSDFQARVTSLTNVAGINRQPGAPNDPAAVANYNGFLAAALETGEAPRLIHFLGGDQNEASRILSLPPMRMAVELTKLVAKLPAIGGEGPDPNAPPSGAPRPIRPVGARPAGGGQGDIRPDDPDRADQLSSAEWFKRREAQVSTRQGRA